MEEINFNETPTQEAVESEKALKCDSNQPKKSKTPAMFKAGIALMCATSALSLGAIGACGFLGYKLYKNQKNQNSQPEDSMGTVVTNKGDTISVSEDGYWVINGVKSNTKAEAIDGIDGSDGVSVVNASIVTLDKWGITTQIMFKMSDNSYVTTAPQTQILSEHFYEAESMSDILTLTEGYGIQKIKLANDINLSSSIEFNGDAVIDLNRNTLNYTAARPLTIGEESSLTFKNGSLYLLTNTGVAVEGTDSELSFNKVNVSATAVVAETLEDNASINLENSTVQTIQQGRRYNSSRSSSVGSLFVVKGEHSNIVVSGSNFTTSRTIVAAGGEAAELNLVVKESKINTSASMLDIDTSVVVPTLDVDQTSISTIESLNTTPITSGSYNFDPTDVGATLEGVEQFDVNGSSFLAEDFASLVEKVESGSTINLTKDIDLEATLEINKKLTINLGSYTLSAFEANTQGKGVINVVAGGDLTIVSKEYGVLLGNSSDAYNIALRVSGGKATINGGMFSNAGAFNPNDPLDTEFSLFYVSGGELVINDGIFMANSPKWTINVKDAEVPNSNISVNGGIFYGYNPAESHTENPLANFLGDDKLVAGFDAKMYPFFQEQNEDYPDEEYPSEPQSYERVSAYAVTSAKKFADHLTMGFLYEIVDPYYNEVAYSGTIPVDYIYLNGDVVLNEGINIQGSLTLELGDVTISAPEIEEVALFTVDNGMLTINGKGTINSASQNNDYSMAIWAKNGGRVIINDGKFTNVGARAYEVDENGNIILSKPNNNELIYVSGSGSYIEINGGEFIGNHENETHGTKFTLNQKDSHRDISSIVVNGGSFYKFNPADNLAEGKGTNFVSEGYTVTGDNNYFFVIENDQFVYKVGNNFKVAQISDLVNVINNNAGASIMLPTALVVTSELTINLNGCTISTPTDTIGDGVFHVVVGGNLTINGNGTIDGVGAGEYHMAIWVDGGKATINGGTYTNEGATEYGAPADQFDLMYVKGGELVINGGTFTSETPKWTLNLHDTTVGTITVNGGTFVGYNPAASETESPVANFVAEGYTVEVDGENYVVVEETVAE